MSKSIRYVLYFFVAFALNVDVLFAQQDNPVIGEALKLAASLDNDSKIQANAAIQRAQARLGTGNQDTDTLKESFEAARKITDAYQRSQAFRQIARGITPENINSYDEILKEDAGYFVLEAILEHCRSAEKYDLGYQLFEKIFEQQTDPEVKRNMRFYINRIFPMQIYTGKIDEAVASATRLKDAELRQFVLGEIRRTADEHLLHLLLLNNTNEDHWAVTENMLKHLHPDVDVSDREKVFAEVFAKMTKETEQITEPGTRFDAYMNLVNVYRNVNMPESEVVDFDFELGVPRPPKPAASSDPALSKLLLAAAEAAKNVKENTGNFTRQKRLARTVRLLIENADTKAANQIVNHMLTIPAQIENPHNRADAILETVSLLYQLNRKAEADKMCNEVMKIVNTPGYSLEQFAVQIAIEKANAGLFKEAKAVGTRGDPERVIRGFIGAYFNHVSRLLDENRFDDALQFIDEEPTALGDKIRLLQAIGRAYRQSGNVAKSDETFKKMFELVDTLTEKEAGEKQAGKPDNLGIQDDRRGGMGASLAKTYSHPIVKQRRECGDFAGAVDLASKLFATHVPEAEILYVARGYANAGDYAGALEVGGSAGGEYCSDSGIRGYTAHAMLQHGKKEEAEKLLTETLREVDNGTMTLHRDFIVGLILCGKIDDAIRLSTTMPVVDRSEHSEPTDKYSQYPTIVLRSLLMTSRESDAVKIIDEWNHAAGKAWGIRTLIQWDYEEHLGKGNASLITPELKKRWRDFLVDYADTFEEPNAINRIGEWYRTAECLVDLDAKESALKVLDKALTDIPRLELGIPDHIRSNSINVRVQTGRMLIRLGECEKADIAFVAAVKECSLYEQAYRKAESLRYTLFDYTEALLDKPEEIRTWPGYIKSENDRHIRTMRYLWERSLFSVYGIE